MISQNLIDLKPIAIVFVLRRNRIASSAAQARQAKRFRYRRFGSCFAIGLVFVGDKLVGAHPLRLPLRHGSARSEIWNPALMLGQPLAFDALDRGFGAGNVAAPNTE